MIILPVGQPQEPGSDSLPSSLLHEKWLRLLRTVIGSTSGFSAAEISRWATVRRNGAELCRVSLSVGRAAHQYLLSPSPTI
jgi:hypothetical protein